jgi:hypothetical protein
VTVLQLHALGSDPPKALLLGAKSKPTVALSGREVFGNHRDNLSKAGWTWGCVAALDCGGRTIWIAGARGNGKRFVVRADKKLTAFLELERAVCIHALTEQV